MLNMNAEIYGIFQKFSSNVLVADLLSTESIVGKFSALDHHMWPKECSTDVSKEAFALPGRADMESLCYHYENILVREGTTASEVKRTPIKTSHK